MRSVLAAAVLLSAFACASAREATRREPQQALPGQEAAGAPRQREVTWAEYYAGVKERAWRRGAAVIWINPPEVRKPK